MSKVHLKNLPKLKLGDLLRRRKMLLNKFLGEFGITTHEGLVARCDRMGVLPPTVEEFKLAVGSAAPVNNPSEGVVVLEAPPVIDDLTGRRIDPDAPAFPGVVVITSHDEEPTFEDAVGEGEEPLLIEPTEFTQKKPRKKKEATKANDDE